MNSCSNHSNQNLAKEVCSNVPNIEQTNYSDRYVFYKTKKGCVTYKVTKQISDIFLTARYQPIFSLLNVLEDKLNEPLTFTVELDYITLEGFKRCFDGENGYENLQKILGSRIFELLNDLSIRKTTISAEKIQDNYLGATDLQNLREYYDKYHDIVMDCFSKNYTSLCIYDVIYRNKCSARFLNNFYDAIRNKNNDEESTIKREYASMLLVEYLAEMSGQSSERTREEMTYQMAKINTDFKKLDKDTLSSIPRDRRLIIDHVFNLL